MQHTLSFPSLKKHKQGIYEESYKECDQKYVGQTKGRIKIKLVLIQQTEKKLAKNCQIAKKKLRKTLKILFAIIKFHKNYLKQ